jgi:hypothetical protein
MKKLYAVLAMLLLTASLSVAQYNANSSLTASTCTAPVKTDGRHVVLVTVSGTWTGTLQVSGLDALGNKYSVSVLPTNSTNSTTWVTTITTDNGYWAQSSGFNYVLVCGNTVATGSPLVALNVSSE